MVTRKQETKQTKSNITTLNVRFLGPFGFCVYNYGNDRHVSVQVPDLMDHDYWVGTRSLTPPYLDRLPRGNGVGLRAVDSSNSVKLPDAHHALVVDAADNDIDIETINQGRNAFRLPCPALLVLDSVYSVNGIFKSKSKLGAANRINKRQQFIPDCVNFVYSLSNGRIPTFDLGDYHWEPSDVQSDTANLSFIIGPQQEEVSADDPAKDFSELVALFPKLDLSVTKFPIQANILNPPYHCRATSLFVDNPPPDKSLRVQIRGQKSR